MTILSAIYSTLTGSLFVVLVFPVVSVSLITLFLDFKDDENMRIELTNVKVAYVIYQTLFHPLSFIPGPFWSKLSSLPLVYQCRRLRKTKWVLKQHSKYGSFVRISPNHISITDPAALSQIYGGKTGFPKGPFYEDMFLQFYFGDWLVRRTKLILNTIPPG